MSRHVASVGPFVAGKLRGVRRRLLAAVLSLPPVRRRLARRARAAWAGDAPLTFVCLGNICRSPFAEHVARERLPGRTVASAGTLPKPGRPSPEHAVTAAGGRSIDLTGHRSRVVDASLFGDGRHVFVFDVDNLLRVRRDFPDARDRVHLLGTLADDGPVVIPDPYGKDVATFERTYGRIADVIDRATGAAGVGERRPPRR